MFVKKEIATLSAHQHKALCAFKIINLFQTQPVFTGIHNNLSGLWGKLCMNSYVLIIQKRINTIRIKKLYWRPTLHESKSYQNVRKRLYELAKIRLCLQTIFRYKINICYVVIVTKFKTTECLAWFSDIVKFIRPQLQFCSA